MDEVRVTRKELLDFYLEMSEEEINLWYDLLASGANVFYIMNYIICLRTERR